MSSARPAFRVASLASIAAIPFADVVWLPLRSTLGLGAFGVNAYRADAVGQRLIEDHTEASIRAGRGDEGLATLAEIASAAPGEPWRTYDYACGLALTGQAERAIEASRAVLELEPEARAAAVDDPDFQTLRGRADRASLVGVDR